MADIITGTVSGMVDTSGLVRDTSDLRREVALESNHVTDVVAAASNLAGRDASSYYIAESLSATQTAKEIARSQAWTEAKIDAGFIKVSGDTALASAINSGITALEAAKLQGSMALQHSIMSLQIANEANTTRALINHNLVDDLRAKSEERYMKIVEMEGDRKHSDREYNRLYQSGQQNQWGALSTQLQMLNSDLQSTRQAVNNFGSGTATGGAISSNHV